MNTNVIDSFSHNPYDSNTGMLDWWDEGIDTGYNTYPSTLTEQLCYSTIPTNGEEGEEPEPEHDYSKDYFTFVSLSDGNEIKFCCEGGGVGTTIEASTDSGETWTEYVIENDGDILTIATLGNNEKVLVRGENETYCPQESYYLWFETTESFNLEGNIMSLIYGEDFIGKTEFPEESSYNFAYLLDQCDTLISAKNLILPATTLASRCYSYIFEGCTSLVAAPELPATTLAEYCYLSMFTGCISLTTAPKLSATTLAQSCYAGMFCECEALVNAPELPATTLADYCYANMFSGCISLNYIKCLAKNTGNPYNTTYNWVSGVAASGTFVRNENNNSWKYGENGIPNEWNVTPPIVPIDYMAIPLTFEAVGQSAIIGKREWYKSDSFCYSIDNGTSWQTWDGTDITLQNYGDKVMFKAIQDNTESYKTSTIKFTTNGSVDVYGNIMSLLYSDFYGETSLGTYGKLEYMFSNCSTINSIENIKLPATELTFNCYYSMFSGCSKIKSAPQLPAMVLSEKCYQNMFSDCSSLTNAPELPATTLANECYHAMFQNCTSLSTAPELPATTLTNGCYESMFIRCASLTSAPELPATTLAENCYRTMFRGCTSLITAPELPATTLAHDCYYSMFYGCTSIATAPSILPSEELVGNCYKDMFNGCTSLTTAPELPATTLSGWCYYDMFRGCTSLTTAPELPATTLVQSCYQNMFYECTSLNYIKCLATDISASGCTANWVQNASSTGTFVKNASMSSWTTGVNGIPENWTVEDAEI